MRELGAVALVLGAPGSCQEDTDLVFFNAPHHPRGIATVAAATAPGLAVVRVDLARCEPSDEPVVVALSNHRGRPHCDAPLRVTIDSVGTRLATSDLAPVGTESERGGGVPVRRASARCRASPCQATAHLPGVRHAPTAATLVRVTMRNPAALRVSSTSLAVAIM